VRSEGVRSEGKRGGRRNAAGGGWRLRIPPLSKGDEGGFLIEEIPGKKPLDERSEK